MDETVTTAAAAAKEDARLARAFLAGDRLAFDRLVARHQDRIYNLCLWILGDPHEADDAAQETFIKAYRSLQGFRFKAAFSTWLYRIAVNTCKNHRGSLYARIKKKTRRLGHIGADPVDNPLFEVADTAPSQDKALERKQTEATIMSAIGNLPQARRSVVILRDVEGMSYDEIAAVTGVAVGTVKSRLARGRRELQKALKGLL